MTPTKMAARGTAPTIAKALVAAVLLAALLVAVDPGEAGAALAAARPLPLATALAASVLGVLLSAEKWRGLLLAAGVRLSLAACARLYWVGMFASNFLPTSVGGDAARFLLTPAPGRRAAVAGSILVERLTGFLVMLGLCTLGLALRPQYFDAPGLRDAFLAAVLALDLGVVAALLAPGLLVPPLARLAGHLPPGGILGRAVAAVGRVAAAVAAQARDPAALARALGDCSTFGLVPMAVVATAGTTDFGAVDPLAAIADLCDRHGTWLHVDAAYGGGLLVSPTRRHLLDGIERADSVTIDFHKTWFQPVSASAVVVRDRRHLAHVAWHADYLNPRPVPGDPAQPNQVDKSLQTTRRFDALKLWMTLRVMGPDAIGEYVDAVCDLARATYDALDGDPDLEVAAAPGLSTLVLRFRPAGLGEDDADLLQPRIRRTLYERGTAMVAATKVAGRCWLKLTLLNPLATLDDVLSVLGEVRAVGRELTAEEAA